MACQIDVANTEGVETFDFNQWIDENALSGIKHLLVKHQLNKYETLSFSSPQYIQFMCDPILLQSKSHFIPKILKAIQSLNNKIAHPIHAPFNNERDIIVISEKEQYVMDTLKQHMLELSTTEINIKELKIRYSKSVQHRNNECDKQIETAQQKIKNAFENIKNALQKRERHLLTELDKIKTQYLDNNDIDAKEIDSFEDMESIIARQQDKITANLKLCDKTLREYKNEHREKRKEIILNTGQQYEQQFNLEMQSINKKEKMVKELISQNDGYRVNISCNLNESNCNKVLKNINILGAITVQNENEQKEFTENEEKGALNILQEKYDKLQQEYDKEHAKLIHALSFTRSGPYRWYKEEKEQYIPVQIIDKMPMKCVKMDGTGEVKTNCQQMIMIFSPEIEEITECVTALRHHYEGIADKINWQCFDKWGVKDKEIIISDDTISKIGTGYKSIFGDAICKAPFTYHWKLKQIHGEPIYDCYIGIEQNGKETTNDYFCNSKTGYSLSVHYGQLYANGKWGAKYGKPCYKTGDVIDVYLDLRNNVLSYAINGTKYGKAYDVRPGQYRLAVTIRYERVVKLVYSAKYT